MGLAIEIGIDDFLSRRKDFFVEVDLEGSFKKRIEFLKDQMEKVSTIKPKVVVLGRGPAGLIRAIQAMMRGYPTTVLEKRSENAERRANAVFLTPVTIGILKYYGVYQYLEEQSLIYPPLSDGSICVRLGDLEEAMLEVLHKLNGDSIIEYDSQVRSLALQSDKVDLTVNSSGGAQTTIAGIDILINTEGSRSTTNDLLRIGRVEVLPTLPVFAVIFKDERTFCSYIGRSIVYIAITIYYHVQFFFRYMCSSSFRKQIIGAIILKTPGQNYLGCGFSDEINQQLLKLKGTEEFKSLASHWIRLAICYANLVAILSWFKNGPHMSMGVHFSLNNFDMIKIGADHSTEYSKLMGKTTVLLAGDSSATVEPTTGLGCNTAIQSSVDFLDYLWDREAGENQTKLQSDYNYRMMLRIAKIHAVSKEVRTLYQPAH